jgi:hypothetical protein
MLRKLEKPYDLAQATVRRTIDDLRGDLRNGRGWLRDRGRRMRMNTTPTTNGHIRELTREEGIALLDREARRRLHMSGEEFIRAWEAGEFDDDPDRPEVMYVAMLLPFAR